MIDHPDRDIFVTGESLVAPNDEDFRLAKELSELLDRHYPGHLWAVSADHKNGIVTIQNLRLSGRWGFIVKIANLANDPGRRSVIRAGGELLERYNVARGRFNVADLSHLKPWARPTTGLGL